MEEKINNQIRYLEGKGFIFSDIEKVKGYLVKVGLHRLRRYFNTVDTYIGTDFQKIINAYIFDKELRGLNLQVIEIIEKSLKNILILQFNNYLDKSIYTNIGRNINTNTNREKIKCKNRLIYIERKIIDLKYNDIECLRYFEENGNLSAELFYDNLTFGEVINIFYDLNLENQYKICSYFNISLELFKSWIGGILYLRNISSHGKNIFNRKMTKSLKGRKFNNVFGNDENSAYISYLYVLNLFLKQINPDFKWLQRVFDQMDNFNIDFNDFSSQKEIPHIEHSVEAWEILVQELYG